MRISILWVLPFISVFPDDKDWVYVKPVNIERANVSLGPGLKDNPHAQSIKDRIVINLTLQVVTSEDGYHEMEHILGWYDEDKKNFYSSSSGGELFTYYCNDKAFGDFEIMKSCLVSDWFRIERRYLRSDENKLGNGARFYSAKLPKRGKRVRKK